MRALGTMIALALVLIGCSPTPAAQPAKPAAPAAPAASTAAAPAAATASQSASAKPDTVVVGYITVTVAAPIYVAIEKGYFAQQNLEVQLESFTNGADILTQTAAGHLNIGAAASVGSAALNALQTGVDVKILMTGHAESRARPTTTLMLRKVDGRPFSVAELRGRKAAINSVGVATEYVLGESLRTAGLTIEDTDLVQIPFPDMLPALTNGSIDAGVMAEPFLTRAAQAGVAEPLAESIPEHMQTTVTYMNSKWAAQNPDVVRRYALAHLRGIRDLQGDAFATDEVARIINKYIPTLPPEVIKTTATPYFDPSGKPNLDSIMDQQRFFLTRGSLKYAEPLNIRDYVDDSFVDAAAQQLGPARQ